MPTGGRFRPAQARCLHAALFVLCAAAPALAFDVDVGPEAITMQGTYNKPALFPHRKHQQLAGCNACHHVTGRTMTIGKCESCHDAEKMKNADLDGPRKVAHLLCKGCHKKAQDKGVDAPLQCRFCHPPQAENPK